LALLCNMVNRVFLLCTVSCDSRDLWHHLTWRFHSVLPHIVWHGVTWTSSDVGENGILLCSVLW
jgi:hypothetical protein